MLSLRYSLRQFEMASFVSNCEALKWDEQNQFSVSFTESDVQAMGIITKMNSLLYQAMELTSKKLDSEYKTTQPGHGVCSRFLDDVCIVIWPPADDNRMFLAKSNPGKRLSGWKLRELMFTKGFDLGGKRMLPLLAGAGMARQSKMMFVSKEYRDSVLEIITNGLIIKAEGNTSKIQLPDNESIVVSKLLSYVGLASSDGQSIDCLKKIRNMQLDKIASAAKEFNPASQESIGLLKAFVGADDDGKLDDKSALIKRTLEKVEAERKKLEMVSQNVKKIIVVKDVKAPLKADGYTHVISNDLDDKNEAHDDKNEAHVVKVVLSEISDKQQANVTDGYGFISPELCDAISELRRFRKPQDDKIHCSYIIRMPFVKGNLLRLDYRKYLKARGVSEITDRYNEKHKLEDVEIILTDSMFKGLYWFKTWKAYMKAYEEKGLSMIIAGADNPTEYMYTRLNYQVLSTLQPEEKDLEDLYGLDKKQQDERLKLLKKTDNKDLEARAKLIADYLQGMEKTDTQQQIENLKPQEEENNNPEKTEEDEDGEERTDDGHDDETYEQKLSRVLRKYPKVAKTRLVMEAFAENILQTAMELGRGRPLVKSTTRRVFGDPFILLNDICKKSGGKLKENDGKHLVGGKEAFAYLPGVKGEECLLQRSPHVSPFENMVVRLLNPENEDPAYSRYKEYMGDEYTGVAFINSLHAAGLAGADFDGDIIRAVLDDRIVKLAEAKESRIIKTINKKYSCKLKHMPYVSINSGTASTRRVDELNKDLWAAFHKNHVDSIASQVGEVSLKAARYMFNNGSVTGEDAAVEKEMQMLLNAAKACCMIGLDIDYAKTSYKVAKPRLGGGKNGEPPVMRFSKKIKESNAKGLKLYLAARNYALSKDNKYIGADVGKELVSKFDLIAYKKKLEKWQPVGRYDWLQTRNLSKDEKDNKKTEENGKSFTKIMTDGLPRLNAKGMTDMREAVREAEAIIGAHVKHRSALNTVATESKHMYDRRAEMMGYLLSRYPMEDAFRFFNAIMDGKAPAERLELYSDTDVLKYAVMTNEKRRNVMYKEIFGVEEIGKGECDIGFRYDADCYQLAKAVRYYRDSKQRRDDALNTKNTMPKKRKHPVVSNTGEMRAAISEIATEKKVDLWHLGLHLLKKGAISEERFILLFANDCPDTIAEEKTAADTEVRLDA